MIRRALAACAVGLAAAGLAQAAVPRPLQGTFRRHFTSSDFPNQEEPTGVYTMRITASGLTWKARGLGVPVEQAKTIGRLLLVRDKPGSIGRLCAQNGWGTYRYTVRARSVSFVKVKEPCKERGLVLAKTWRRRV